MNVKSFFFGILVGVLLTFVGLLVMGISMSRSEPGSADSDPIQYLSQPESYEGKKETSVKVFQVLGNAALANEISNKEYGWYNGNTVMILGKDFYSDQIITIKNPQRIGTYSYTTKSDMPMTVPVIESGKEE